MKAKLIKVFSSHENLRTKEVEGEIFELPKEGNSLVMTGSGLEFGTRVVVTSKISSIYLIDKNEQRDLYHLQTQNSEYVLEVYSGPGDKAKEANRG